MGVVRVAVGCAVVALLAGHGLSRLDPAHRAGLWASMRPAEAPAASGGQPPARALPAPPPRFAPAAASLGGEEVVDPDRFGQFQTAVEIEGQRIPVMVDTGASFVALSAEDADRLGIRPMPSDFRYPVNTANGRAFVAKVELRSVRLGAIELRGVEALVSDRGQLGRTLLGMSFLSRLSGVRIDRGRLLLAQ